MLKAIILGTLLSLAGLVQAETPTCDHDRINNAAGDINTAWEGLPLYFIENQGQLDEAVAFYIQGADKSLYFTSEGLAISLVGDREDNRRWNVLLDFVDADPMVAPRGEDKQPAVFSFFKGAPKAWKSGLATYAEVVYEDLWPGIDLVYKGTVNRLKYEFRVHPGADPSRIRLRYRGAEGVTVKTGGTLQVRTPLGSFEDGAPYAYQMLEGAPVEVSMAYRLEDRTEDSAYAYGFELGDYDRSRTLVLDPEVVVYCGYLGGQDFDCILGMDVDNEGAVYVTGFSSPASAATFPLTVGPDLVHDQGHDAFVAKVNARGTALDYCGYIGGDGFDVGYDIVVDNQGHAYVVGETDSSETSFPVWVGPNVIHSGLAEIFVAKVNPQGTGLEYCGYIGGGHNDHGRGIALDAQGNAYVTGYTYSLQWTFPVTVGPNLTHSGSYDAFVAKVNALGTGLDYCGYLGGSDIDYAYRVAVDNQGRAYVAGKTNSAETEGFPVLVGPDLTFNEGFYDAYVARVNAQGSGLDYCGFIGGDADDEAGDIAVDGQGNAYVTGTTDSDETSFPVLIGPDLSKDGLADAFVAKVDTQGTGLVYCGYIGGLQREEGHGIALDQQGNAYVAGETSSYESSFPVLIGPDLTFNGFIDAFVAKVSASGSRLDYGGYLGGLSHDYGLDIAVNDLGHVYLAGDTYSPASSFPVQVGPDLTYNQSADGYVAKLAMALIADQSELSITGGTVRFDIHGGEVNAGRVYLLLATLDGTDPGTPLPGNGADLPLNWGSFTDLVLNRLNSPIFADFLGVLDVSGNGTATLNAPAVNPNKIGQVMHYAYLLEGPPWNVVSHPVAVEFVP